MKIGVQGFNIYLRLLDSGFRRNDDLKPFATFYDFIKLSLLMKPLFLGNGLHPFECPLFMPCDKYVDRT